MSNPIKGMVAVISNYGVGKTTFALECGYHPREIVFINDDVKEVGFENDFKQYIDLVSVSKKKKLLDFHSFGLDLIKQLPKSKVIIWDTWTQFQSTFPVYVKAHLGDFRNPNEWSAMGKMKAGEIYQEAYRYEGAVLSELKAKCDLLILTFHLKQVYHNNVAVLDKFKPGHDKAIEKYADLRIWLTPSIDNQVPVGLVMKNISRRGLTDSGSIGTSQVLPKRISTCNWRNIFSYWNEPIGDREPREDEKPNRFEMSLIEGSLTPEDRRLYEASLPMVERQEESNQAELLMTSQSEEKAIKNYIISLGDIPGPAKLLMAKNEIEAGRLVYDGEITNNKVGEWSK